MTSVLAQVGLSNLVFGAVLAALAYAIHRTGRSPAFSHLLWVLVLVKAVTPPFVLLPVMQGPLAAPAIGASSAGVFGAMVAGPAAAPAGDPMAGLLGDPASTLVLVWAVGSVVVLIGSVARIRRFDASLRRSSSAAPPFVVAIATEVARTLGLRTVPAIELSSARVSPMTWWLGRRVRVVIPCALLDGIEQDELRLILAHELAHVRRRDHVVRWLEWVARVVAWWNPIVWWAQQHLREAEEASCDALVLDRLAARPRSYAHALLSVVEFLAAPAARQPAFATGMGAGATLERRFRRILSEARGRSAPLWLRAGVTGATLAVLVLGIGATSPAEVLPLAPTMLPPAAGLASTPVSGTSDDGYSFVSAALDGPTGIADGGRAWDDRFVGGPGADDFTGGHGDDRIDGRGGADDLSGGRGDDLIRGGPGRDTIEAGPGDDLVVTWQDGRRDAIDCGAGEGDRAIADMADDVVRCEVVDRRRPTA